jgi:hypothetical protein
VLTVLLVLALVEGRTGGLAGGGNSLVLQRVKRDIALGHQAGIAVGTDIGTQVADVLGCRQAEVTGSATLCLLADAGGKVLLIATATCQRLVDDAAIGGCQIDIATADGAGYW